jgi:hypothetical protein
MTNAFKVARAVGADTLGWIHLRDDPPIAGEQVVNRRAADLRRQAQARLQRVQARRVTRTAREGERSR